MLREIPARVRFLSCEPLLAAIDSLDVLLGIHWCIVGGESGPKCRPMDDEWARWLRDLCRSVGTAFFLKQLGGFPNKRGHDDARLDGNRYTEMPASA